MTIMPDKEYIGDGGALMLLLLTLVGFLPAIAAAVTIIYTGIRIIETPTVQALVAKWKERHGKSDVEGS